LVSTLKAVDRLPVFSKINSTLPRSAAVERRFSAAGQVLTSRRSGISDVTL